MNRAYYQTPAPGPIMRLLWKCAGADRYLLERSTYSDQVKYMCMGGIVLATGIMAAMAGGYAFYTIFEPKGDAMANYALVEYGASKGKLDVLHIPTLIKSMGFGLIWGLVIFNIDRFIVSSSGKGDGTEAITWSEFKGAIPRILMGMIIALTISKPIEIRMFKSEIDSELQNYQDSIYNSTRLVKNLGTDEKIESAKKQLVSLRKEIDDAYAQFKFQEKRYLDECQGQGSANGRGCGPIAEAIKMQMVNDSSHWAQISKRNLPIIDDKNNQISAFEEEKKLNEERARSEVDGYDGLLMRIKLAEKIAGFWISLFITLLFMAIELTPIFFKLMLIQGPYDYMSDNIKELIKAENGVEVKYDYYKDKSGQERHLVVHHKAEVEIFEKVKWAESQKEITDKAIDKWKNQQLSKIDENLSDFIKED